MFSILLITLCNFNYSEHDAISNWQAIEEYIHTHPQVNEVILSGGDPLSLSDEKLQSLINNIENIPHIKNLRFHTRSAVVTPSRITTELVKMLGKTRLHPPLNITSFTCGWV
jgi:L-lysine 2,3-aminomutase